MHETVYKCDRCKKIIPNFKLDFDQVIILKLRTSEHYRSAELCQECHNKLVDWFEGRLKNED